MNAMFVSLKRQLTEMVKRPLLTYLKPSLKINLFS